MKDSKNKEDNKSAEKIVKKEEVVNPKQFEEQRSEDLRMDPQPLTKPAAK